MEPLGSPLKKGCSVLPFHSSFLFARMLKRWLELKLTSCTMRWKPGAADGRATVRRNLGFLELRSSQQVLD